MKRDAASGYRTPLERWMRENRYSDPALALRVAEQLRIAAFSHNTVRKWRRGESRPRPGSANARALREITGWAYEALFREAA